MARNDQKVRDPTLQDHRHNYENQMLLEVGFIQKHILETCKLPLLPRIWKQYVPPKRWYLSTKLHPINP